MLLDSLIKILSFKDFIYELLGRFSSLFYLFINLFSQG